MTRTDDRLRLRRLIDRHAQDILEMSDAELRESAGAENESVRELAEQATSIVENAIKAGGRERLARAREGLAAKKLRIDAPINIDVSKARKILDRVRRRDQSLAVQTIAARNGTQPSDEQSLEILQDLVLLGVLSESDFKD